MRRSSLIAALLVLSTSLAVVPVSAQESPPEPPPPPQPPPPAAPAAPPPAEAPAPPPAAPPPAAPPPAAPPPAAPPPPAPPAVAPAIAPQGVGAPGGAPAEGKPADEEKKDEVKDGVRVRGGFSVGGGVMILPNNASIIGPAITFAGRIGVQFNHYFGLVYQNTPLVTGTAQQPAQSGAGLMTMESAGLKWGFVDYNALMAMLTFGHFFDLGGGPSLDFLYVSNNTASASLTCGGVCTQTQTSSGVSPGIHARVAFNIGGLNGNGPRRSGFAIGVDGHSMYTSVGWGGSLTGNLGGEWY